MRCITLLMLCLICASCTPRAAHDVQQDAQVDKATHIDEKASVPTDITAYVQLVGERVRSHWHYEGRDKRIWRCTMFLLWDAEGKLTTVRVETPSGNEQFDASALNAVQRCDKAGALPPPPVSEGQRSVVFIFSNAS